MSLRKVTPCDISGICPYNAEVSSTCEYWCGEEEPEESLKAVKAKVDEISSIFNVPDSYMLWGMMKELIEDNGFDFYKAMDEKYNG